MALDRVSTPDVYNVKLDKDSKSYSFLKGIVDDFNGVNDVEERDPEKKKEQVSKRQYDVESGLVSAITAIEENKSLDPYFDMNDNMDPYKKHILLRIRDIHDGEDEIKSYTAAALKLFEEYNTVSEETENVTRNFSQRCNDLITDAV